MKKIKYRIVLRKYKFPPEISEFFFGLFLSWSIIYFAGMVFFYFYFFGWKVQGSVFGNIRNAFFWENIRIFLILELNSSISGNMRNFFQVDIFKFGWKVCQMALICTTAKPPNLLHCFFICTKVSSNLISFFFGILFWLNFAKQKRRPKARSTSVSTVGNNSVIPAHLIFIELKNT